MHRPTDARRGGVPSCQRRDGIPAHGQVQCPGAEPGLAVGGSALARGRAGGVCQQVRPYSRRRYPPFALCSSRPRPRRLHCSPVVPCRPQGLDTVGLGGKDETLYNRCRTKLGHVHHLLAKHYMAVAPGSSVKRPAGSTGSQVDSSVAREMEEAESWYRLSLDYTMTPAWCGLCRGEGSTHRWNCYCRYCRLVLASD